MAPALDTDTARPIPDRCTRAGADEMLVIWTILVSGKRAREKKKKKKKKKKRKEKKVENRR